MHTWYTPEITRVKSSILVLYDKADMDPNNIPLLRRWQRKYRRLVRKAKLVANGIYINEAANPCKAAWELIKFSLLDEHVWTLASGDLLQFIFY